MVQHFRSQNVSVNAYLNRFQSRSNSCANNVWKTNNDSQYLSSRQLRHHHQRRLNEYNYETITVEFCIMGLEIATKQAVLPNTVQIKTVIYIIYLNIFKKNLKFFAYKIICVNLQSLLTITCLCAIAVFS